jgi:hypothetical protein
MAEQSDKLSDWPELRRSHDESDCCANADAAINYQRALSAAWESRCRVAVEALALAMEFISYPLTTDRDYAKESRWEKLQASIAAIGPLPESPTTHNHGDMS